MKKKSLYDIAMEKKDNSKINNIIIERKKSFADIIFKIIEKTFKLILYLILFILITIGATVILNSQTREIFGEMLKNVF